MRTVEFVMPHGAPNTALPVVSHRDSLKWASTLSCASELKPRPDLRSARENREAEKAHKLQK